MTADAAPAVWPFPSPGPRVVFAEPEPEHACENCARLQAELAAARQQIEHLNRLALRNRSTAAGR